MKFTKWLITAALPLLALTAQADNLYREGTKGYELAAYAEKVLPKGVSPFFMMAKDRDFFIEQMASNADTKDVLSPSDVKNLHSMDLSAPSRTAAWTKYVNLVPGVRQRKVCVVVFMDPERAAVGSTLMHELMHCRIEAAELTKEYGEQIMRVVKIAPQIDVGAQLMMFEEVFARAMSLSFLVNEGLKEDADFFLRRKSLPYPSNPGPKSVPRVMHICIQKGNCSTDVATLAKTLLDDDDFVSSLRADMVEGNKFNLATGFSKK
jgi:hypothetical protein